jgi:hypothetical protein
MQDGDLRTAAAHVVRARRLDPHDERLRRLAWAVRLRRLARTLARLIGR